MGFTVGAINETKKKQHCRSVFYERLARECFTHCSISGKVKNQILAFKTNLTHTHKFSNTTGFKPCNSRVSIFFSLSPFSLSDNGTTSIPKYSQQNSTLFLFKRFFVTFKINNAAVLFFQVDVISE